MKLLDGVRLVFEPTAKGYRIHGPATLSKLVVLKGYVPKGNRDKVDSAIFRDCSLIGGPLSRGCDPWGQADERP
jgi:hypothetical protein